MNFTYSSTINPLQNFPVFPPLLAKPIGLLPQKLHSTAIVKVLNRVLQQPLQEGDLDFLQNQSISVEIDDLKLRFALSLQQEKLIASNWQMNDDLNLRGSLYDFFTPCQSSGRL